MAQLKTVPSVCGMILVWIMRTYIIGGSEGSGRCEEMGEVWVVGGGSGVGCGSGE